MLGAIIGDIVGSVYEFHNHRNKDFQPLFHPKAFFTDDTVCTIAVADALVNDRHPAHALKDWGTRYWANGGWGRSFALWLASDGMEAYNSYGNGAAMRVAPAGLLARSVEEAIRYRRPYQTRHTYASMMLSAGENVMYVANQMGHADWSMLVRVYGHWIPSGSAQSAGSLVAAAQTQQWQRLDSILQSRPLNLGQDDGDDDSDDDDEADCEEFEDGGDDV